MTNPSLDRLVALVRRELGADSVRVLDAEDAGSRQDRDHAAANVLYATLPDGRRLAVVFAEAPAAKDALERRLAMLTATFAQSLEERGRTPSRPAVGRSLQEELRALAVRARAADAAVIDAHSPVVWGAASAEPAALPPEELGLVDVSRARMSSETPEAPASFAPVPLASEIAVANSGGEPEEAEGGEPTSLEAARALTERAIAVVRELPGLDAMRKGRHVAHTVRDADLGVFARSFASIYLLVLAFDGPFDELRAERAVEDALPRIERLVMALPPLDPKPAPIAGVVAMRRRRR